ncbi:hypothetical protein GCM10011325_23910 [Dyadobacter sediminis]|nr:hypothetical protein GCM10011325_23910 [Dyadobacter sediminis]
MHKNKHFQEYGHYRIQIPGKTSNQAGKAGILETESRQQLFKIEADLQGRPESYTDSYFPEWGVKTFRMNGKKKLLKTKP